MMIAATVSMLTALAWRLIEKPIIASCAAEGARIHCGFRLYYRRPEGSTGIARRVGVTAACEISRLLWQ